jgi:hypothetical protein
MDRPAYVYGLAVVGGFVALGAGVGLAANFTLGFFIEQFVDPGAPPLESTQVGLLFLVSIFFVYGLGPVGACVAAVGVGRGLAGRPTMAGLTASAGSVAGFVLYVGIALGCILAVLSEYGSGGGGGGGPLDPAGLGTLLVQVCIPVGLVGLATGAIVSRVAAAPGANADDGDEAAVGPRGEAGADQ